MWPCSGTVFVDRLVERPHIRRLSRVAIRLRHLLITPFQTDKLFEGDRRCVATRYDCWPAALLVAVYLAVTVIL